MPDAQLSASSSAHPSPLAARWMLSGRRALVTGGTKGIGAAIAEEMLNLGATVTIVARTEDAVQERAAAWTARGLAAQGIAVDVTSDAGRAEAMDFALTAMGGLDILVNNVGTNVRKATMDFTPDEYARVMETNLTAAWAMCRAAYPALKDAGTAENGDGASIVNIGSVAGSRFVGTGSPYALSKAALDHLTHYLAAEWARDGIRVNSVNPWYTRTPLAAPVLDDPERMARVLARTPMGRVATAEDVAGVAAFLCLPAAAYVTGQCVAVDGGFLAYAFRPDAP